MDVRSLSIIVVWFLFVTLATILLERFANTKWALAAFLVSVLLLVSLYHRDIVKWAPEHKKWFFVICSVVGASVALLCGELLLQLTQKEEISDKKTAVELPTSKPSEERPHSVKTRRKKSLKRRTDEFGKELFRWVEGKDEKNPGPSIVAGDQVQNAYQMGRQSVYMNDARSEYERYFAGRALALQEDLKNCGIDIGKNPYYTNPGTIGNTMVARHLSLVFTSTAASMPDNDEDLKCGQMQATPQKPKTHPLMTGIAINGGQTNSTSPALTMKDVEIEGFGKGIESNSGVKLNFQGSKVNNNGTGIENHDPNAQMTFEDSQVNDNDKGIVNQPNPKPRRRKPSAKADGPKQP